ncbi:MAG: ATP cone domain-containing protein [Kiritimatiellae bacterium]|nr:ATP cone domain-containing protein [Kiritimatiellia bacterium]MDD5523362.1 ATP cone domain-containing protein [Kiritimatiellia bacterium]
MKSDCPIKQIIKRDGSTVAYNLSRISNAILKATASTGTPNPKIADTIAEKVEVALVNTYGSATIPSVEDIQDVVESVLMENRLTRVARNYIIYRHQRAMARAARAYSFEVTDNVPYKKLYEVLRWNIDHSCDSVQNLNKLIKTGGFPEMIKEADKRYFDEIKLAADRIVENRDNIRIVLIAGPSSSGKTTTTIKLSEQLGKAGIGFKAINIDHYFFDLGKHPRDEFGDYDYETPQALDLDLINEHLVMLLDNKIVKTPHYDFKSGIRQLNVHDLKLDKNEILLIDSLHGLYDGMTSSIPAQKKFRLYIETLGQFRSEDGTFMRWSDNRLLRRMIRDKDHRNLKPIQTLTHWHYVRRSELKNIIPYIQSTDYIVNSALPYELPFLKIRLFKYISKAIHSYREDPKRLDAHIRANRVYELLKHVKAVKNDSCVPSDSLLREFIGGSRYRY